MVADGSVSVPDLSSHPILSFPDLRDYLTCVKVPLPARATFRPQYRCQVRPFRATLTVPGGLADVRGRQRHVVYQSTTPGENKLNGAPAACCHFVS